MEKIKQATPEMSDSDFYYSLQTLLSKVGDAHTTVNHIDSNENSNYEYPSKLVFTAYNFEDDWHLIYLNKENESHLGSQLISINGVLIDEVFERCKTIMSFENEEWAERLFSDFGHYKEELEFIGVVEKDEPIIFTVKNAENIETELTMIPLKEGELSSEKGVNFKPESPRIIGLQDIYRGFPLNENNFFIQYNSCEEDPNLSMLDFTQMMKEEITKGEYTNIIIDLRYNSGGNSIIMNPLLNMLNSLQDENNFKVHTLIGKRTFSSGLRNAIDTVNRLNSTLVGTPTGGNVKGYTEKQSFHLKNHPITVNFSTKYYEYIIGYSKDSLYPDIEIKQTFEDYSKGIDPEVEWVLANN